MRAVLTVVRSWKAGNIVLILGMVGWSAAMTGYLVQGKLPDAFMLGVPGGLIAACRSDLIMGRRRPPPSEDDSS